MIIEEMPICDRCIHINECDSYAGILSLKPTATKCKDFIDIDTEKGESKKGESKHV